MQQKMHGLSSSQARRLLAKFGYNEIPKKREFKALKILLGQFTSVIVLILIAAGILSIALHETIDGIAILAIVVINAIIGFIQEYKAENAVASLKKLVIPKTIVMRDGRKKQINIRELVPGDIVILEEGDKIPADMEVLEGFSLNVDESMLTGESVAANKENKETLYKGTIITSGRATAKVTGTGKNTEFGKIIELVSKQEDDKTPLAIQLDQLGKRLALIVLVLVALLFVLGYLRGIPLINMLITSIALGVSAIPEGLPIIVTLTLAIGVQLLAKKKAIVRKMNAIETLGATTVICSDKTGTLTLNEMTVKHIFCDDQAVEIPGLGYKVKERIKLTSLTQKKLLEICENCNNSSVSNRKQPLGDPTEISLKILTEKAKYRKKYTRLDELVFSSDRKMMSTLHKIGSKKQMFTKGAFEEVIKRCTHLLKGGKVIKLTATHKKALTKRVNEYSKDALRVLGLAYKDLGKSAKFQEKGLIFVGLVAMIDPPRKEVKAAIAKAQQAQIKIKIITGDHPITAKAIGQQIGLNPKNILTGSQIDKLTDRQLTKAIYETDIFARTKPDHKYRIVNLLKKKHEVVAVTGDGVNDAPAIKHADVGIAMGIKGTEATKEVADIVLKDDNFSTIVATIEEGRRIYKNILAFIKYMISANFDTILAVGVITLLGFPLPILALQVLWINIATDALPALALGQSKAGPGIMDEKPHPKGERIFKKFFRFIAIAAFLQVFANLIVYFYGLHLDTQLGQDIFDLSTPSHARTLVFTQIVMFELFFAFVCKEEKSITFKSLKSNKYLIGAVIISFILQLIMIYTPFMQETFKTVPLLWHEWLLASGLACTAFLVPVLSRKRKAKK